MLWLVYNNMERRISQSFVNRTNLLIGLYWYITTKATESVVLTRPLERVWEFRALAEGGQFLPTLLSRLPEALETRSLGGGA